MMSKMLGQKTIAWILFFVFYLNFIASGIAALYHIPGHKNWGYTVDSKYLFADKSKKRGLPSVVSGNKKSNAFSSGNNEFFDESGGPSQPEMASFKSVGADNMVNLFTGDFSYNIPLLDVGGYPINIFYSGGIGMEQEASWVGLGWNINPGSITRNMRGLPDDFDGTDVVKKTQNMLPDQTYGVSVDLGTELFGANTGKFSTNMGIFYNNHTGLGLEVGGNGNIAIGLGNKAHDEMNAFDPSATLGVGFSLNSQSGLSLQPTVGIRMHDIAQQDNFGLSVGASYSSRSGISSLNISGESDKYNKLLNSLYPGAASTYPLSVPISFARPSIVPSIRMPLTHSNTSINFKTGGEVFGLHGNVSINGYFTKGEIKGSDQLQIKNAAGYLYMDKGVADGSVLEDFNRMNDGVYTPNTPMVSIPYYTYDIFNISGEGTGGSFRAYRGNVGMVRDAYTKTKSGNDAIGLELGSGQAFHGGVEYNQVNTPTTVYKWSDKNNAESILNFKSSQADFQGVYFKNPGEKAIVSRDYYNALGGDQLARIQLQNDGSNKPTAMPALEIFDNSKKMISTTSLTTSNSLRSARDKRSQVISYLTADEAEKAGFDKEIYTYPINDFYGIINCDQGRSIIPRVTEMTSLVDNYRRKNHLSEINVLEPDGKRYIYGIPVYNISQKDVTFSVSENDAKSGGIVTYYNNDNNSNSENSTSNTSGKDHYYQSELMPAYPHSFLLTALLSPDYVDVTNNGITDDDLGTAVKFNYSKIGGSLDNYKWRTPFSVHQANIAHLNEGNKTDKKDDKATYTYGEREAWYLHSIESKNMVAVFTLGERKDNAQPKDENGNISSVSSLKRLDRIDLYAKSELINKGFTAAKPIKSVWFKYSYKLCPGTPLNAGTDNSADQTGKLTLESVYFTYNGNNSQKKNIYVFGYANNPAYQLNSSDRWGTYKPGSANLRDAGGVALSNTDFPYSVQPEWNTASKDVIDANASAWNLNKVLLPSGSQINISYEADDYAYVQNKRASQMLKIAGFGKDETSTPVAKLFSHPGGTTNIQAGDFKCIFIDVPQPIISDPDISKQKLDIYNKYLEGINQLLLRLSVRLPADAENPSGYEPFTVYANIDASNTSNYGVVGNNLNRIWVKVNPVNNQGSPMMATVTGYLRDNFPEKAYPGFNVNPSAPFGQQLLKALAGMIEGFITAFDSFDRLARTNSLCTNVDLSKCFVRLNNPLLKKVGGGYRVKEIRVKDNWDKMTGKFASEYGQHYDYSITAQLNGTASVISSGVATYEPAIGAEENPFKAVLDYSNSLPLGPTQHGFIDMPFGETFYPSPMVGYSKVRVTSIHTQAQNIKSGVGTQETEFYTAKEFPSFCDFTNFDPTSNVPYKPDPILSFLKIDMEQMVTLSQGFRIVLNDMNGKMKSQSSYAETDNIHPINYTRYFYKTNQLSDNTFSLNNTVSVAGKDGLITTQEVGKDIEVMTDFREHKTLTTSTGFQANTDGFTIGPFPVIIPMVFKPPMRQENTFRSATMLKVINTYGIIDSVLHIDKGSMVSTKNLIFDSETGDVLVSRTQNEFNRTIYSLNYPAYWAYSGMEPAYKNIDVVYDQVVFKNGLIESAFVNQSLFESGDEIYVSDQNSVGPYDNGVCQILSNDYSSRLPRSTEFKIWALSLAKDARNGTNNQLVFIDKDGTPYNSNGAFIRIIRSGKRNLLSASVGAVTSLESPIVKMPDNSTQLLVNDATSVVNAQAMEYKEKWRGEDAFYTVNESTQVAHKFPVHNYTTTAIDVIRKADEGSPNWLGRVDHILHYNRMSSFLEAESFDWGTRHSDLSIKSLALFDFNSFPSQGKIINASLSLYAHNAYHYGDWSAETHYPYDAHKEGASYGVSNFIINRLLQPWPSGYDATAIDPNTAVFGTIEPYNTYLQTGTATDKSNKSFCSNCGTNGSDNRLDISYMVADMVRDKFVYQNNNATGFQLDFSAPSPNGTERRVCFNGLTAYPYQRPQIDTKYYLLSEEYGLTGNPAIPPAGQDVYTLYTYEMLPHCYSVFGRQQMNPYLHGILGNWKNNKNYVFYGDRKESDASSSATNIQKNGIIQNFIPYWQYSGNYITPTANSNWVWNSQVSQYNRKGLEIENFDPLNRFNCGIYGYNDNLPIAVVNNARYRESGFDGFEDYSYSDKICSGDCKIQRDKAHKHWNLGIAAANISNEVSHTGLSSLVVPGGGNDILFNSTVSNINSYNNSPEPDLQVQMNATPFSGTVVIPNGTGLTAHIKDIDWNDINGYPHVLYSERPQIDWFNGDESCDGSIFQRAGLADCNEKTVEWLGKIQVPQSGTYKFTFQNSMVDDRGQIDITNTATGQVTEFYNWGGDLNQSIYLAAGSVIDVDIRYWQETAVAYGTVVWQKPGDADFSEIPIGFMYNEGVTPPNPVSYGNQTVYCYKPGTIQAIQNPMIDSFALLTTQKMVLSTWVKQVNQGGADCACSSYTNSAVEIAFDGNTALPMFSPAGNIIDGWQRYECVFEIPATAQSVQIKLRNLSSNSADKVYYDDLRIHPYNANMKSFVYHPQNLRLMAELDENNYATFYEYDNDGTLTRVKKETKEGIKTIKETRSAIQKNIKTID